MAKHWDSFLSHCTMGIQQHQDQRGRRMESGLPNKLRTVRTNSHVLQIDKLARNVPVNNGPHLLRPHQHRKGLSLHQQHHYPHKNPQKTLTYYKGGFRDPPNKQTLHQTGEVQD